MTRASWKARLSVLALLLTSLLILGCDDGNDDDPADTAQGEISETDTTDTQDDQEIPQDLGQDLKDSQNPDLSDQEIPDDTSDQIEDLKDTCTPECPLGSMRCDEEGRAQACIDLGDGCTSWGDPQACEAGTTCTEGVCEASCNAEDTRCLNAFDLQTCTEGQLSQQSCLFGCDAVNATCNACQDGAMRCEGSGSVTMLERCLNSNWQPLTPCDSCACAATSGVVMQCLGANDTPTTCSQCTPDQAACLP